jgi:sugar phosphate isomerase/epimerase
MIFSHSAHDGRRVRLAYCHNLHPADELEAMLANMRAVTLPLRDRVAKGASFGVGLYLSGELAGELTSKSGDDDLKELALFLEANKLDPFTWNAFPHGKFHEDGLKTDVFQPTWKDKKRVDLPLSVARAAVTMLRRARAIGPKDHLSISTHTGMYGAWVKDRSDIEECIVQMARVVDDLARMEEESGVRIVLSLEPEPRANASTGAELAELLETCAKVAREVLEEERNRDSARAKELLRRHLGWCLDACHAAVEFEGEPLALRRRTDYIRIYMLLWQLFSQLHSACK